MKPIILSHLRFHADRFENDAISERDFLQTVVDLCVERIVDLDQGRDDGSITGSYNRSELAGVLVEAEMMNSQPPTSAVDLLVEDLEVEEIVPVCPKISCNPPPFKGTDSVHLPKL